MKIFRKNRPCWSRSAYPVTIPDQQFDTECLPPIEAMDLLSAQVLLQEINPLIEGFQRPTLGPVRNFSIVSGEFMQLFHTGQNHWVCQLNS